MRIEAVNAMTGMIAICKQEAAAQYRFLLLEKAQSGDPKPRTFGRRQ
jgi:hypothetical protein